MGVAEFLADQRVPFETLFHAPAFSAQRRAKHLHLPGDQVAKCVLLRRAAGYLVAVLPATRQIDLALLSAALGESVRLGDDREAANLFRDCEWGVVPPFGTLYGVPTLLDDSFDPEAWVVFEGRLHVEAIRMLGRDFERLERPQRLRFAV